MDKKLSFSEARLGKHVTGGHLNTVSEAREE